MITTAGFASQILFISLQIVIFGGCFKINANWIQLGWKIYSMGLFPEYFLMEILNLKNMFDLFKKK